MSRRMEKLQGVHAQDAVLLESFGWAPGNVWWQRKMKVLERRKIISQALIPQSFCSCEHVVGAWEGQQTCVPATSRA